MSVRYFNEKRNKNYNQWTVRYFFHDIDAQHIPEYLKRHHDLFLKEDDFKKIL